MGATIKEARLIKLEEAYYLKASGKMSILFETSYWTGTAYDRYMVWQIFSSGQINGNEDGDYDPDNGSFWGVRPVIVI